MLYAVLIYDSEVDIGKLGKSELDALITRHERLHEKFTAQNQLGPVVRLMPTRAATTFKQHENAIIDGPFAETKEQLLGFYVIDCATREEAMEDARLIGGACNAKTLEVRPVELFYPGIGLAKATPSRPAA
jgi:hypothetical protein